MSDAPSEHTETAQTSETTETVAQTTEVSTGSMLGGGFLLLFFVLWILGGFAALIMSIVCFGFSGSTTEKVVGILLAFFLGPLYFIFYGVNKNYCRNLGANVIETANRVVGGFKKSN